MKTWLWALYTTQVETTRRFPRLFIHKGAETTYDGLEKPAYNLCVNDAILLRLYRKIA